MTDFQYSALIKIKEAKTYHTKEQCNAYIFLSTKNTQRPYQTEKKRQTLENFRILPFILIGN